MQIKPIKSSSQPCPRVNFTPIDPSTITREKCTANITTVAIPDNADATWAEAVRHQQRLHQALYDHDAMAANRQQTFSTPAKQKSRVYHMWDFVGRTLAYFYMLDYTTPSERMWGREKEIWTDAYGRYVFSKIIMEDTSGKADMMFNVNIDVDVPFAEEVMRAVAAS